ncbi:MAG: hypothetical protein GKR87_11680 [Kiritimatiellae bacterium]|nr:hypothetical protein [Kiritimatiellia bacterium]
MENVNPPVNLSTIPSGSGTLTEGPLVIDSDNDGQVEIILAGDALGGFVIEAPLRVYESTNDAWQSARNLWNQRGYRYVNVNDDLTIPATEQDIAVQFPPGSGRNELNTYGVQPSFNAVEFHLTASGGTGVIAAADVTVTITSLDNAGCPTSLVANLTIQNVGSASTPSNMPMAFYDNNPIAVSANLLAVSPVGSVIAAGGSASVQVALAITNAPFDLYVVVNDDGSVARPYSAADFPITTILECNYLNNLTFQNACGAGVDPSLDVADTNGVIDDVTDDELDGIPTSIDTNDLAFGGLSAPDKDGDGIPNIRVEMGFQTA